MTDRKSYPTTKRTTGKATIVVRPVGQAFGCAAVVYVRGRRVHETRVFPYDCRGNAYAAAEAWCADHNLDVGDEGYHG